MSLRNVLPNFPRQIAYIVKQVEEHFQLQEAYKCAKELPKTATNAQKMQNWSELTLQLLKTIFGEIYAVRLMNLTSMLQFSQTAKLFYQLEKKGQAQNDGVTLGEDGQPIEEEIKTERYNEAFKQQMQAQSEEFIRDIFSLVFWPVIEQQVLPLVNDVAGEALQRLSPKDKVSKVKFLAKITMINDSIMEKIFMTSTVPSDEDIDNGTYLIDSDEDQEPEDHSLEMNYNYSLADKISAQYEKQKSFFKEGTLKRELADELIDIVNSELFAGALFELL